MLPVRPRSTHPPVGPLEGEPLRVPPSNASLPPLLGHLEVSCDQRGIPPWNPNGFGSEAVPLLLRALRGARRATPMLIIGYLGIWG
jgi:hypothetical protein